MPRPSPINPGWGQGCPQASRGRGTLGMVWGLVPAAACSPLRLGVLQPPATLAPKSSPMPSLRPPAKVARHKEVRRDARRRSQREYRLIVQLPDETHLWQARLERAGEVLEFQSPLELLAWLEADFQREDCDKEVNQDETRVDSDLAFGRDGRL